MFEPISYEYTTQDNAFTVTITFNTDQEAYAPETIIELCEVLEQTSSGLRFSLENPNAQIPFVMGRPS